MKIGTKFVHPQNTIKKYNWRNRVSHSLKLRKRMLRADAILSNKSTLDEYFYSSPFSAQNKAKISSLVKLGQVKAHSPIFRKESVPRNNSLLRSYLLRLIRITYFWPYTVLVCQSLTFLCMHIIDFACF